MKKAIFKKTAALLLGVILLFSLTVTGLASFAESKATPGTTDSAALATEDNLALNKDLYTYWSQHNSGSFGRPCAVDGDLSTGFHGGDGPQRGHWIAIDLGEVKTFDTVEIWENDPAAMFPCFEILVFQDISVLNGRNKDENINDIHWSDLESADGAQIAGQYYDAQVDENGCYTASFAPVQGRLVVIAAMAVGNRPWMSFVLADVGVFSRGVTPEPPAASLLASAVPAASSSHEDSNWSLDRINDGDHYNFNRNGEASSQDYAQFLGYHSGLNLAEGEEIRIEFTLAEPTQINRVVIWPSTAKYTSRDVSEVYLPESIEILGSSDGDTFTTLATVSCPDHYGPITVQLPESVSLSVLCLSMIRTDHHVQLSEVEAFCDGAAAPDPDTPDPDSNRLSTAKTFDVVYQTRKTEAGKEDVRIVLVTNLEKLKEISSPVTVTVTFTLTSGAYVDYSATLASSGGDYRLYRSLTAAGETFTAGEGCALFGDVILGVPEGIYSAITVTVTDPAGTILLNARS